jgi:hypothetical protein
MLLPLTACVSWHTQHGAVGQVLSRRTPDRVRLTVADSQLIVWQPRVVNDSLFGTVVAPGGRRRDERALAISLQDIQRLETHGFNSGRTIGLGLGSLAVATAVALFVALGAAISASD